MTIFGTLAQACLTILPVTLSAATAVVAYAALTRFRDWRDHLTGVALARLAPSMPRGLVTRAAAVKEF